MLCLCLRRKKAVDTPEIATGTEEGEEKFKEQGKES